MAMLSAPHVPPRSLLGGNLADFRSGRLDFLTRCARQYGDVVSLRFGPRRILLVSHPALIENVLVTQSRCFIKHFALRLNPLVLGNGLLTSEGDFWLRQRRLIQPAFQRSRLAGFGDIMVTYTQRLLAGWKRGETRDIVPEMMRLTMEIAAKTLFDADVAEHARDVGAALQTLQENFIHRFNSIYPPPLWLPTRTNRRLKGAIARLNDILYGMIRARRASGEDRGDLLSLLLHARDEGDRTGMTDRQLRDEAMTLFLAGHETTALALSWAWHLLATHPEAEARLAAEADEVLGDRPASVGDLPRLRFTEGVALESMRLYPPAYVVGREAIADCEVGGYRVPRGTTVLMSQWVVHRDPRFFEMPDDFRPERWSGVSMERGGDGQTSPLAPVPGGEGPWLRGPSAELPKYAYFPFGGGPRVCIGNTFAMMELVLVLATIAQQYRFKQQPGHQVVPWPTFTLRPQSGVPARLTRRK
jgi:cytochrome P450